VYANPSWPHTVVTNPQNKIHRERDRGDFFICKWSIKATETSSTSDFQLSREILLSFLKRWQILQGMLKGNILSWPQRFRDKDYTSRILLLVTLNIQICDFNRMLILELALTLKWRIRTPCEPLAERCVASSCSQPQVRRATLCAQSTRQPPPPHHRTSIIIIFLITSKRVIINCRQCTKPHSPNGKNNPRNWLHS
jgi:hypothetical protein